MKKYTDLLKLYSSIDEIPYVELLRTQEWHDKRVSILNRDKHQCQLCSVNPTIYLNGIGDVWLREDWKKDNAFLKDGLGFKEVEIEWVDYFHEITDKSYYLHVHHQYYILSKLPWEYPDDSLITYCNWCHWQYHENNKVPVFKDESKIKELEMVVCQRCHGAGWFPQYKHVDNGVCFECSGNKYTLI